MIFEGMGVEFKVGVLIRQGIKETGRLSKRVISWLKAGKVEVYDSDKLARRGKKMPSDLDLLIVLGGEGPLLYAAGIIGQSGISVLDVNMGGLGFLTEVKKASSSVCW